MKQTFEQRRDYERNDHRRFGAAVAWGLIFGAPYLIAVKMLGFRPRYPAGWFVVAGFVCFYVAGIVAGYRFHERVVNYLTLQVYRFVGWWHR